jgi:hypothetical protein
MGFYNRVNRPAQMTLLIGNHLGDLRTLVGRYLPKPAIDRTTYRMTELLKSRYGELPQGGASESQQTDKGSGDDS